MKIRGMGWAASWVALLSLLGSVCGQEPVTAQVTPTAAIPGTEVSSFFSPVRGTETIPATDGPPSPPLNGMATPFAAAAVFQEAPGEAPPARGPSSEDTSTAALSPEDNWFHQGNYRFQIGGQYRIEPNFSNFPFEPQTLGTNPSSENFAAQRMRLWVTVETDEHVEGYIQLQVGGFGWGDNYEFPKTFAAPLFAATGVTIPNDQIGIMLRRGWVSYKDDDVGKFRVGVLDWHDSFGDTLASSDYEFDIAGVDWTKTYSELGNLKVILGGFVLIDEALLFDSTDQPGSHDAFMFTCDVDKPIGDCYSVGGSVYNIDDHGGYSYPTIGPYHSSWDLWLGLRARSTAKELPWNAFVIYNPGERDDLTGPIFKHNGWASKLEAGPIPFGPGKFSAQVLWSTGESNPNSDDSSEFRTPAQTYRDNDGSQGYWGYLWITSPNAPADVKDLGVSLQDRGLGLFTVQTKYEIPLSKKLTTTSAAGWLWSSATNPVSDSRNMGPEVAQSFTYNFGGGLTFDFGASVLFTGEYWAAAPLAQRPNDLWMVFSRLQLEF